MSDGEQGQSCCGITSRVVLCLWNVISGLLGLVLFVASLIVLHSQGIITNVIPSSAVPLLQNGAFEVNGFFRDVLTFTTCVGFFIFMLAIMAFVAACCRPKVGIILYLTLSSILCLAVTLSVVLFFLKRSEAIGAMEKILTSSIANDYKGDTATDAVSTLWTFWQQGKLCCGVHDYTDYNAAVKWKDSFNTTTTATPIAPISCCELGGLSTRDPLCPYNLNTSFSYKETGCFGDVEEALKSIDGPVAGAGAGLAVWQLLLTILAVIIYREKFSMAGADNSVDPM